MQEQVRIGSVGLRTPLQASFLAAVTGASRFQESDPSQADVVLLDGFSPKVAALWQEFRDQVSTGVPIVLLSVPSFEDSLPSELAHIATLEDDVARRDGPWAILRCSAFGQEVAFNAQFGYAGACFAAWAEDGAPWVDLEDVLDMVLVLLDNPDRLGAVYDVAGPDVVSVPDALQALETRLGGHVLYMPLDVEDHAEAAVRAGFDRDFARLRARYCEWTTGPGARQQSSVLKSALGRDPRAISTYLDHAFGTIAEAAAR